MELEKGVSIPRCAFGFILFQKVEEVEEVEKVEAAASRSRQPQPSQPPQLRSFFLLLVKWGVEEAKVRFCNNVANN